jgi:Heavy metal associated domain 2
MAVAVPVMDSAGPAGRAESVPGNGDEPAENEPAQADRTGIPVQVVPLHTAVKGRVRFKVGGLRGAPELARLIARGLTGFGGVREVSASALTGNVLVCYADTISLDQIISRTAALLTMRESRRGIIGMPWMGQISQRASVRTGWRACLPGRPAGGWRAQAPT